MKWIPLLLASALPAQSYSVGPGGNYASIGAAISAVPDGATLLVRAGQYPAFRISGKSLTILCDPGVYTTTFATGNEIDGLAAHQQVTIRGLETFNGLSGPSMSLHDNAGTVVLDTYRGSQTSGVPSHVTVTRCADVHFHGCTVANVLYVTDSHVRVSRTNIFGNFGAIDVTDGSIELADSRLQAGFGLAFGAVNLSNAEVRVLPGCSMSFGLGVGTGTAFGGTGRVRMDPSLIVPTGAVLAAPTVRVATLAMPVVAAGVGPGAGAASASLDGPSGAFGVLFFGAPALPTQIAPGLDPLIVQPGSVTLVAWGVLGAPLTFGYSLPSQSSFQGLRVAWQGASLDPAGGPQISNGVIYVHP